MTIAPATRALARLAWRELRHRRGRSVLVIALVAMPVAALVVAAVLNASNAGSPEQQRPLVMGGADVVVQFDRDDLANGDTVDSALRRLPPGSRAVSVRERLALVSARDRDAIVDVTDLPLDDPLATGKIKLLRGHPPVGAAEVAASPTALRDLGLRLGDTLVSRRLGLRARIAAEVVDPDDLHRPVIISGAPLPAATSRTARLLVDLPPGNTTSAVARLRGPGREVKTAANCCPDERPALREVTLAVSGLALFVVGLVVAAAFAISARRQLRTIGLLSAAAGADERHIRRLALLQGTLCGGAGVIAGFTVGLAIVKLFFEPHIDDLAGRVTGGVTLAPVELGLIAAMAIAATAAGAWRPGRTAARIPVLAALGGRRPLRAVPATVPIRALATSAIGTVLLAVGLNGGGPRGLTLIGAVLIVLGFVLCAPALVAVLERLASRAPGITRLAARDIARQRARTGPLVAAILAVASLAVLGSTLIGAIERSNGGFGEIRGDEVMLTASGVAGAPSGQADVPAQLRTRVRSLLPRSTEAPIGSYERRDAGWPAERAGISGRRGDVGLFGLAIGGPQLLEFLGAEAGRAAFDRGEVVALADDLAEDGHVQIEIPQTRGPARQVRVAASHVRVNRPITPFVISTQAASRLGFAPTTTDLVFRTPDALTSAQEHALQALALSYDRGSSRQADTEIRFAGNSPPQGISRGVDEALLAIAALLTLAVVASGLALSAAEGKADDTMLVALGADPTARRRFRATQAGLLVETAGLLAIPAGLIPAAVIIHNDDAMLFAVPWTAATIVLIALPTAAAAGAWLLTRPARWSPPATWAD
jgi:putative ABC transport system permease protein